MLGCAHKKIKKEEKNNIEITKRIKNINKDKTKAYIEVKQVLALFFVLSYPKSETTVHVVSRKLKEDSRKMKKEELHKERKICVSSLMPDHGKIKKQ